MSHSTATGSATTSYPIFGEILKVHLDFHASAPATTDTTIITATAPQETILIVTNSATDGFFYPRAGAVNSNNGAITDSAVPRAIADKVTVSVAQSDALTGCVAATIWYRDLP